MNLPAALPGTLAGHKNNYEKAIHYLFRHNYDGVLL